MIIYMSRSGKMKEGMEVDLIFKHKRNSLWYFIKHNLFFNASSIIF